MKPENKALLSDGIEIVYTTKEVAKIFRKTRQWVLLGLKEQRWLDDKEQPFVPARNSRGAYSWTARDIKNIGVSCYNARTIDITELKRIYRKVIGDTGEINERY